MEEIEVEEVLPTIKYYPTISSGIVKKSDKKFNNFIYLRNLIPIIRQMSTTSKYEILLLSDC